MASGSPEAALSQPLIDSTTGFTGSALRPLVEAGGKLRRIDPSGMIAEIPFDPSSTNAVFGGVLNSPAQAATSLDGIRHVYSWADFRALDELQLGLQWEHCWGAGYRHWHRDVFLASRTTGNMPKKMLIVGVPAKAQQIRFLLETYPTTTILGIELNPENQEAAMATLIEMRPTDVESGRVDIRAGDAIELLPTLDAHSFDFVEADKVASHCETPLRKELYEAIIRALAPGGIFHLSDIIGGAWEAPRVAPGFENDQRAKEGVATIRESMPVIVRAALQGGKLFFWDDAEHLATETLEYAPQLGLIPSLSANYLSPHDGPGTREDTLTRFFVVAPVAGIEAARMRQDSPELEKRSSQMRQLALRLIGALETEGVLTALPEYAHLALELPA